MTMPKNKRLGRYILQEPLGKGSEGSVFHALQVNSAKLKPCVVKLANEDGIQPERFLDEARRAMDLADCPSIVSVIDADIVDGIPFFAMDFADGTDLGKILRHRKARALGPLPLVITFTVLDDLATALNYAHVKKRVKGKPLGLVHRDVKPGNLLVTYEGHTKLLDFGISTSLSGQDNIRSGGTPRYMSPEHIYGPACPAMDIYSVGVIAWELAEGESFRGKMDAHDHIAAIINGDTPPLRNKDISAEFAALIQDCLKFDPAMRPTAKEFRSRLRKLPSYRLDHDSIEELLSEVLGRDSKSRTTGVMQIPGGLRGKQEALLEHQETIPHEAQTKAPSPEETPEEPTMLDVEEAKTVSWRRPSNSEEDAPRQRRKKGLAPPIITQSDDDDKTVQLPPPTTLTELLPPRVTVIAPSAETAPNAPTPPSTPIGDLAPARSETVEQEVPPLPPTEKSSRLPLAALLIVATLAVAALGTLAALWIAGG